MNILYCALGDVNVIEYLLRRGCTVNALDNDGRGPLHWAVLNNRQHAVRFLIQNGCNALQVDNHGASPMSIARLSGNIFLIRAVSTSPPHYRSIFYDIQQNYPAVLMTFVYGIFIFFLWVVVLVVPYYINIPILLGLGFAFYKTYQYVANNVESRLVEPSTGFPDPIPMSTFEYIIYAPEKYLGLWLGSFTMTFFYLCNCINSATVATGFLEIQTGSAYSKFQALFWINATFFLICVVLWVFIVWLKRNPGIVQNRKDSFEKTLEAAVTNYGDPPSHLYCRTTLCQKPIRSKYCTSSGVVIARFDHYCVWLCNAVGTGNHR